MAEFETLLVSKKDGVATVILNRPEVRNAVNQTMRDELRNLWTAFRYDDEVRCVVLTGAGHSFCTGIDRAEAVSEENNEAMARGDMPGYPTPWMYDDPGRDVGRGSALGDRHRARASGCATSLGTVGASGRGAVSHCPER